MTWTLVLNLLGVFFFAISGSLLAASRGFDIIGSLMLGSLTGLGGGVIRDLIIGVPPATFAQPVYFVPPVLAAVLVYFLAGGMTRYTGPLLVFDAGGLALFCTGGAVTALGAGMNPSAAVVLGATTGVGGGLLRDVVANRDPQLFNRRDLYAVPALLGAGLIVALESLGWLSLATGVAAAGVVFTLRVLSLHYHWRIPSARASWVPEDA